MTSRCPECGRFLTVVKGLLSNDYMCTNPSCGFGTEESDYR